MRFPAPAPRWMTVFLGVMLGAGCASDATPATTAISFRDPQGTYTMNIDADWTETTGTAVKDVEVWKVASVDGGFATNVTVITQSTQGLDLAGYLTSSVDNIGAFKLVGQKTVQDSNGNDLGLMEYSGLAAGGLHYLAVIDVSNGQAVVATLTATEAAFVQARVDAEPYLLSLHAT
jgi:hypothetical protein